MPQNQESNAQTIAVYSEVHIHFVGEDEPDVHKNVGFLPSPNIIQLVDVTDPNGGDRLLIPLNNVKEIRLVQSKVDIAAALPADAPPPPGE